MGEAADASDVSSDPLGLGLLGREIVNDKEPRSASHGGGAGCQKGPELTAEERAAGMVMRAPIFVWRMIGRL